MQLYFHKPLLFKVIEERRTVCALYCVPWKVVLQSRQVKGPPQRLRCWSSFFLARVSLHDYYMWLAFGWTLLDNSHSYLARKGHHREIAIGGVCVVRSRDVVSFEIIK